MLCRKKLAKTQYFFSISKIIFSFSDDKRKDNNCETKPLYQNDLMCHWRYKHDVPEFQTILASVDEKSSFHIGYFRDDPKQMPVFVASSGGIKKDEKFNLGLSSHTKLTLMGDNIFGALYNYIQKEIQIAEPFKQTSLQKMKQAIHVHATIKTQVFIYNDSNARGAGMNRYDLIPHIEYVALIP